MNFVTLYEFLVKDCFQDEADRAGNDAVTSAIRCCNESADSNKRDKAHSF